MQVIGLVGNKCHLCKHFNHHADHTCRKENPRHTDNFEMLFSGNMCHGCEASHVADA